MTPSARYEIVVDGKPRSYRDGVAVALEAGTYVKTKAPGAEVILRDLETDVLTRSSIRWTGDVPRSQRRALQRVCRDGRWRRGSLGVRLSPVGAAAWIL